MIELNKLLFYREIVYILATHPKYYPDLHAYAYEIFSICADKKSPILNLKYFLLDIKYFYINKLFLIKDVIKTYYGKLNTLHCDASFDLITKISYPILPQMVKFLRINTIEKNLKTKNFVVEEYKKDIYIANGTKFLLKQLDNGDVVFIGKFENNKMRKLNKPEKIYFHKLSKKLDFVKYE